jgi:two-component system chemotaxis sensor kinase CheA
VPPSHIDTGRRERITIQGLRRLILIVLAVSVLGFTGGVFFLVHRIFANFGPAVRKDLEWKTVQGARELALAADLGLAVGDAQLVTRAFGEYTRLDDVIAIVAVDGDGRVIATHGTPPEPVPALFAGPPATLRHAPGYMVAWSPAVVEGHRVGKVVVVVSLRRLIESQALLRRISVATASVGLLALILGVLFVTYFTQTIAKRDAQLAQYAAGLEDKVAERTAELERRNAGMRLVLDNVDQGFITVSMDGRMSSERSRIFDRWFGVPAADVTFADYIRPIDAGMAEWFTLGLEEVAEGLLPYEFTLDQLPKRLVHGERTYSLAFSAIVSASAKAEQVLVVITDITDEMARERMERDSREMIKVFQRMASDRADAEQFFAEAGRLVRTIDAGAEPSVEKRLIHTLKGNCGMFGLESVVQLCHEIETRLHEDGGGATPAERERIRARWEHVANLTGGMMGQRRSVMELEQSELQALLRALDAHAPHGEIAALARTWLHEPVALPLGRLANQAAFFAKRLGKAPVTVHVDGAGLRLDARRWSPLWSALVHSVSNAVDHGIEAPETRVALGKPAAGTLWLSAAIDGAEIVIEVRDDGSGVDWRAIEGRAIAKGLPHATRVDLVSAMFAEGVSTKDHATTTSGRGVGLAALRAATVALGGSIDVRSDAGKGTSLVLRFARAARSNGEPGHLESSPARPV